MQEELDRFRFPLDAPQVARFDGARRFLRFRPRLELGADRGEFARLVRIKRDEVARVRRPNAGDEDWEGNRFIDREFEDLIERDLVARLRLGGQQADSLALFVVRGVVCGAKRDLNVIGSRQRRADSFPVTAQNEPVISRAVRDGEIEIVVL